MATTKPPYEPAFDHDGKWYPKGPGEGLGYYGGYLFPETRCADEAEAARIATFMNLAFQEGLRHQQRVVKKALGI